MRAISEVQEESKQFVIFSVGKEEYAVEILQVNEIIRPEKITEVPQSSEFIKGVINLRGEIIPVIDLRERLAIKDCEDTVLSERKIITVDIEGELVGIMVDEVREVKWLSKDEIEKTPSLVSRSSRNYIKGVGKLPERLLLILQLDELLSEKEISEVKKLEKEV